MKKFKFRFEAVLLHKKRELEVAQQKVAGIRVQLRAEQEKLNLYQQKAQAVTHVLQSSLRNGQNVSIGSINDNNKFLLKLRVDIETQKTVLYTVQEELKTALMNVTHKLHEKTIFEKLREREFKLYLQNFDKEQMKMIDDIAAIKRKQELVY